MMKNKTIKIFFFTIIFLLFLSVAPARAAEQKTIHLKVAALNEVLFNGDFAVQECADSESGENLSVNAWCAVQQIAASKGWSISSTWFPFGILLNGLGQYNGTDGNYWLWFSGLDPGQTALNQHVLTGGEELLLAYGTSPLKITASNNSPLINSTTTVSTFYFDTMFWQWAAAEDAIFVVNGAEISDEDGIYGLWTSTTTPYIISAKKSGYLESGSVSIAAQLPSKNIKLKIAAPDSILFDNSLSVSACETKPGSGIFTINGYCAIARSGLANNWSWWGNDAFLDSLGGYNNNANGNGVYWQWFNNLEYGQTALNKHVLEEGEDLLLAYGVNPLRVSAANLSPYVNSTTTIIAEEFGLDENWMPIWRTAASSTIFINSEPTFSQSGTYDLLISSTDDYSIFVEKDGCVKSPAIILSPQINESEGNDAPAGGGGGGGGIFQEPVSSQKFDVSKAIGFLTSKQNQEGSFGSSIYTDWAAIALASYDKNISANKKIKEYLLSDQDPLAGLNAVSDYARRAMALASFGINPYSGTKTNYIRKITDSFDGRQFGDAALFNDDIFALLVLSKAGFSFEDEMINKSLQFVLSNQGANGSFQSSDLTAAAIQSLSQFSGQEGIFEATQKARKYLLSAQQPDGSWGNSFSTSWVMQGIYSLGEKDADWAKNNKTPGDYLFIKQAADGGLDEGSPENSRIWATAYAVPAALGKPWASIMPSFAKIVLQNGTGTKNLQSTEQNEEPAQKELKENKEEAPSDKTLSEKENKTEEKNDSIKTEQKIARAEETISNEGNANGNNLAAENLRIDEKAVSQSSPFAINNATEQTKNNQAEENPQAAKTSADKKNKFFAGILSVIGVISRLLSSVSNFLSSIFPEF